MDKIGFATSANTLKARRIAAGVLAFLYFIRVPWRDFSGTVSLFDIAKTGCSVQISTNLPPENYISFGLLVASIAAGCFRRWENWTIPLAVAAATLITAALAIESSGWMDEALRGTFKHPICPPRPSLPSIYLQTDYLLYELSASVLVFSAAWILVMVGSRASEEEWRQSWSSFRLLRFKSTWKKAVTWLFLLMIPVFILGFFFFDKGTKSLSPEVPLQDYLSVLLVICTAYLIPFGAMEIVGRAAIRLTAGTAFAQWASANQLSYSHSNGSSINDRTTHTVQLSPDIPPGQLAALSSVSSYYILIGAAIVLLFLLRRWILHVTTLVPQEPAPTGCALGISPIP